MEDVTTYLEQEKISLFETYHLTDKFLDIITSIANVEYLLDNDYPTYKNKNGLVYWLEHERRVSTNFSDKLVSKLLFFYQHDISMGIEFLKRITFHRTNRTIKNNVSGDVFWLSKAEQRILQRLSSDWNL